ncbi:MAG TPA: helix-hairpin-helix domain-containing protein, partial [Solirubrobacterales bacterium]|nr:helix-hairpin-helix domain-containing protein [Solirubrobacterales bacterium]
AGAGTVGDRAGRDGAGGGLTSSESGGRDDGPGLAIGGGRTVVVHVVGAVRRPGVYRLPDGARAAAALRLAGGATDGAILAAINLAAPLDDGQQLLIPNARMAARGASGGGALAGAGAGAGGGIGSGAAGGGLAAGGGGAGSGAGAAPISLATATSEQLETISGIGSVTAGEILEFRDAQGGVGSIEELDQVSGIGPVTMETLREALVP